MTILSPSHDAHSQELPLKLLVVDDDDVDRERVRRLLSKIQQKSCVTEASSLSEAKELISHGDFDCVFLDYNLGDAIGTDLFKDYHYLSKPFLPIIMITGLGNERIAVEMMQSGAYDYIPKSQLKVDLLETVLTNTLSRAELERDLESKRERLEFLSCYDVLTGLPNRYLFFDRLEQTQQVANRNKKPFAILGIDLDYFKEVNDNFGHSSGDIVLTVIAQRILRILRASDTVARMGGDEFSIILVDVDNPETALVVANKVVETVGDPIMAKEYIVHVGASIGIAFYPDHGADTETLLLNADRAMYASKHGGMPLVYQSGMEDEQLRPLPELSHFQQAIESNELYLEFQPMVDLESGLVCGAEALVRWRTQEGKIIPPAAFIPKVEHTNLIGQLSYYVLEMALDQMLQWRDRGQMLPMSINLSARMLEDIDLAGKILLEIERRELPYSYITLELTETALMSNLEQAQRVLRVLSSAGVKISIDDFGAGFTSFKYLRQLDIAEIKIDMAFTSDVSAGSRDSVIVRSITTLARGFGIPAVAEGIESAQAMEALRALGCQIGQGYYFSRPMSASDFCVWKSTWESAHASSLPDDVNNQK